MYCPHYQQATCQSCKAITAPYSQQLDNKQQSIAQLLQVSASQLLAPVASPIQGFRSKAKMVALGVAQAPILGIESHLDGAPHSLVDCPLYSEQLQALLAALPAWIQRAGIPPYNRHKQKGELKYVLVNESKASGEFMLRFVLKSTHVLERIKANLSDLQRQFPKLAVVSVNIQPVHMARLEGEQEIYLTAQTALEEVFNQTPLLVRPKSFFQTNPYVAEQLYATAAKWVKEKQLSTIWDLFCGVGGFALHCAPHVDSVIGIEIEPEAIRSAQLSAAKLGLTNIEFSALDSAQFSGSAAQSPQLIVVNPPRRGLGKELVGIINSIGAEHLIYSSCNPLTLADDLRALHYDIVRVQCFDMFPHTEHLEVLVELKRRT